MATKTNKAKSAKPAAKRPAARTAAKRPASTKSSKPSSAFTPVSQTIKTTYQNSNGVRRTVIQTTSAPGHKKSPTKSIKK